VSADITEQERELVRFYLRGEEGRCEHGSDLARYASSDMTPEEQKAFQAHLTECTECRDDLRLWESLEVSLRAQEKTEEKGGLLHRLNRWLFSSRLLLVTSAAAVALLLFVFIRPLIQEPLPTEGLRIKGVQGIAAQLMVAAQRNGQTFRVHNGMKLETGDRLGFFYNLQQKAHLMIIHFDEQGLITQVFPSEGTLSIASDPGQQIRVAEGATLSKGHGCEWFAGLFAEESFSLNDIREPLHQLLQKRKGCTLPYPSPNGEPSFTDKVQLQWIGIQR
jgi:hypothetical protein